HGLRQLEATLGRGIELRLLREAVERLAMAQEGGTGRAARRQHRADAQQEPRFGGVGSAIFRAHRPAATAELESALEARQGVAGAALARPLGHALDLAD